MTKEEFINDLSEALDKEPPMSEEKAAEFEAYLKTLTPDQLKKELVAMFSKPVPNVKI